MGRSHSASRHHNYLPPRVPMVTCEAGTASRFGEQAWRTGHPSVGNLISPSSPGPRSVALGLPLASRPLSPISVA